MTRRRWLAALACLGCSLVLSGCWGIAPIEKTGLVVLLGVDPAPRGRFEVTAAIVNPLGIPTPEGADASGQPVALRSASAGTTAQALRRLSATTYLNLDFTHVRGVVVSSALARRGLAVPLGFLARTLDFVDTPWLYVARGESAAAVLQQSAPALPDAGEVLVGTTAWAQRTFPGYADRLFTFFDQAMTVGDQPATLGVSAETTQGKGSTVGFRVGGTALFRSDRLVGWLGQAQTLGWLAATGRVQNQTLVVPAANGGAVVLQLVGGRRRVTVARGPIASLRVRVQAHILAVTTAPANFWADPAALSRLRAAASGVLAGDIRSALTAARAAGSDAFSLGEFVRVQDPVDWARLKAHWNTVGFAHLPVAVRVHVRIGSLGKNFCALLGPC